MHGSQNDVRRKSLAPGSDGASRPGSRRASLAVPVHPYQAPSGGDHILTDAGDALLHTVEHMDTVINAHASVLAEGIRPPLERGPSALDGIKSLFRSGSQMLALSAVEGALADHIAATGYAGNDALRRKSIPSVLDGHASMPGNELSKCPPTASIIGAQGEYEFSDPHPPSGGVVAPAAHAIPPAATFRKKSSKLRVFPEEETKDPPRQDTHSPSPNDLLGAKAAGQQGRVVDVGAVATKSPSRAASPTPVMRRRSSISSISESVHNIARTASKLLERAPPITLDEERQARVAELMEKDVMVLNENQLAQIQMRSAYPFTISFNSTFRHWWDFFITISIAYVIITTPMKVGFNISSTGVSYAIDVLVDLIYLAEIVLNCFTSFVDETTGEEVKDLKKIRHNYIYGSMLIDGLSSFPSSLIGSDYTLLIMFKILKVTRVVKVSQTGLFKSLWSRVNRSMNPSMLRMMNLTVVFLISQHFIACTYYYFSRSENVNTTWAPDQSVQESSLGVQYAHAFYFAIMVTTANDVNPTNTTEKLVTSLMLFVGIVINASIIGSAANLLSNLDKAAIARKNQMDSINDYMRFKKVPLSLQDKIRRYYDYALNSRITDPMDTIFADLPARLKLSLRLNLHDTFIRKVPLFRVCSNAGVIAIIQCLQQVVAMPNEVIITQGEIATDFYFIKSGRVSLCVRLGAQEVPLGNLGEGSFFGESSLLTGEPQQAEVKSESITELAFLVKDDFIAIIDKFPTFYLAVRRISDNRMQTAANVQRMTKMQRRQSNSSLSPKKPTLKRVAEAVVKASKAPDKLQGLAKKMSEGRHTLISPNEQRLRLSQRFSVSRRESDSSLFSSHYVDRISLGQARHLSTIRAMETLEIDSSADDPLWN